MEEDKATAMPGTVVRIDEERIKDHLGRIVRGTVEDTLNALLDAEADRLCNARRYERTEARGGPGLRDRRIGLVRPEQEDGPDDGEAEAVLGGLQGEGRS
jgi:hypothetical protein